MPTHTSYQRQTFLLRYLEARRGRPVPFETLRAAVERNSFMADCGKSYSLRNWQRDKLQLEQKFGFTITSQRAAGYYIDVDAPPPDPNALRLAEALELDDFLALPATLGPYVQPEPRQPLGVHHLERLLRAAQQQLVVDIDYLRHGDARPGRRTFGPLLLREFRGRWYVVGVMEESRKMVCFGLDRIQSLDVTDRPFTPPADFNPATYFANCFGIERPNDNRQPEEIRLRFTETQGRYALSFPLHASQRLESENDDEIVLTLYVYNTHDLRMELLSYGSTVEVLAPLKLRQQLHEQHQEATSFATAAV